MRPLIRHEHAVAGLQIVGRAFGVEFRLVGDVAMLHHDLFQRFLRRDRAVAIVVDVEKLVAMDLEEEILVAVGMERRGRIPPTIRR